MRPNRIRAYGTGVVLVLLALLEPAVAGAEPGPWRVANAAGLPDWLTLSGQHRTRYETLDGQFRAGRDGGDQVIALRTNLLAEVRRGRLRIGAEMLDSRVELADGGTPVNTGLVNAAELLQAYASWSIPGLVTGDSVSELRFGRLTMDVGSRRFVARNRFRNTINAFTGADWQWAGADGRRFRVFYTLPVNRRPTGRAELLDNEAEFDEEDFDVSFWGFYYALPKTGWGGQAEFYFFGLNEDDDAGWPTRDRKLYTPGLRVYRTPETRRFDFQIESVVQFGESRSSTAAANTADLDHLAHFQHVEIGYTFDAVWAPRLAFQYDYASGDDDPTDGDNERFDTLFGARRFDFGPTGIYGPFARSNLSTPGLRLQLKPAGTVGVFMAYRGYWVASDEDAWTTSGVRDPNGASGSFIGHQIEARLRWEALPGNIRLETGVAHLFAGGFMEDAPNSSRQGDATYGYGQVTISF